MTGLRILLLELISLLFIGNTTAFFWSTKKPLPIEDKETKVAKDTGVQWEQCDGNSDAEDCSRMIVHIFDNGSSDKEASHTMALTNKQCIITATTGTDMNLATYICNKLHGPIGCTLHDRQGNRIDSCDDIHLYDGDDEMMLWMVPNNRLFMWPTFAIGSKVTVEDVVSPVAGEKIVLETISREPKIFRVYNFFSEEESEEILRNAMAATDEEYRLKRSSTGSSGYHQDTFRTSENAFDTSSDVAMRLKRRAFELLGISPYDETLADGLQVLRYNLTTAYIDHLDWIEPMVTMTGEVESGHNWDSASEQGTNRYATILLYLSDVVDGGETLFSKANPEGLMYLNSQDITKNTSTAIAATLAAIPRPDGPNTVVDSLTLSEEEEQIASLYLEQKNISHLFPENSWQRKMVGKCRSRLAIVPRRTEAILFYSQFPDGSPDRMSLHAGCPVLEGEKWAANLWVWNGPRQGYWRKNILTGKNEPIKLGNIDRSSHHDTAADTLPMEIPVTAVFTSMDVKGAALYWEDTYWSDMIVGRDIVVNSFGGHKWNVRKDEEVIKSWVIASGKTNQKFQLRSNDL